MHNVYTVQFSIPPFLFLYLLEKVGEKLYRNPNHEKTGRNYRYFCSLLPGIFLIIIFQRFSLLFQKEMADVIRIK